MFVMLMFMILMTVLIMTPSIRTSLGTTADPILSPLLPEESFFVITVMILGFFSMTLNTVIRNFFVDPMDQAHIGHRQGQVRQMMNDILGYGLTVVVRRHGLCLTPSPHKLLFAFSAAFCLAHRVPLLPETAVSSARRGGLTCLCRHNNSTEGNTNDAILPANTGSGSLLGRSANSDANPSPARVYRARPIKAGLTAE